MDALQDEVVGVVAGADRDVNKNKLGGREGCGVGAEGVDACYACCAWDVSMETKIEVSVGTHWGRWGG